MVPVLHREQAVEELPVAFQRNPEILGRGVLAATPLLLEPRPCLCEAAAELFDDGRHQAVCLFDTALGVVDEAGLDAVPLPA